MAFRLKNVLAMVVTVFVIGVSSRVAVCELACGLPVGGCHAAAQVTASMESHDGMGGDCDQEMKGASEVGTNGVASCLQQGCGQVVATVFAKGGSAPILLLTVQRVTASVVAVDGMMVGGGVSGGRRTLLPVGSAASSLTSLRV